MSAIAEQLKCKFAEKAGKYIQASQYGVSCKPCDYMSLYNLKFLYNNVCNVNINKELQRYGIK